MSRSCFLFGRRAVGAAGRSSQLRSFCLLAGCGCGTTNGDGGPTSRRAGGPRPPPRLLVGMGVDTDVDVSVDVDDIYITYISIHI